ncbi:MAG: patatin-like phospholipase family protein [Candidatus Omnitrophica bacterium]|nr:patatin-like phospholipase family protein [Candidatus Omnitrophota bacterium]
MKKIAIIVIAIILAVAGWLYFIKGYTGVRKRHAVPEELVYKADIPGMKNIRFIFNPLKMKRTRLRKEIYESCFSRAAFPHRQINILTISGGGANGAYAAGILCGWTEKNRPQFDIVTGVSTGALIAPAAFLGPSYDKVIRGIYTNISNADIVKQNLINFFLEGRPSLFDTQPLRGVLKRTVTGEVLAEVAREHAKGRRLYIVTTNLDAKRLVIWDMGAIASAGTPEALELFRNVMLASASIPVAFPPVMFEVEAGGRLYSEMHVDGSVTTQVCGSFLIPERNELRGKTTSVYTIMNGKIADVPEEVPYKIWNIASAAFSTLITWQSYAEIYRLAVLAKYEKIHFYFTFIPYEFNESRNGEFDLLYMRKLFYRGYRAAVAGGHWMKQVGATIRTNVSAE